MKIKETKSDVVFNAVNITLMSLFMVLVLYPCIYVVSASVTTPNDVITGKMWLFPTSLTLDAYKAVFSEELIWVGYRNSLIYTVVGTALSVFITLIAAYPLSRKELAGRSFFSLLFAFTMFFSGGMIPSYLLVKDLNMIDTPFALIIPGMLSVWNMVITRTYFQNSIPGELVEASKIDGCSDFTFFFKILLPLSGSVIAVITLYYAVGQWNSYFNALLYINSKQLYPLQLVIRDILVKNDINEAAMDMTLQAKLQNMRDLMKYAVIVVASAPVLVLYPFIQKYFVKGVMIGALKG